ncbi:MAG: 4Fe-4S dicluster domain-containing protein [Thermodesulfobacteriota bacterium]
MRLPDVDSSRCLRLRCHTFACGRCAEICPSGALGFEGRMPAVDPRACTGCGLCVSACPMDGLAGAMPGVEALAARLSSVPSPVLGCTGADGVEAHARVPCLGYLTEEELAALAVLVPQGVQLNATRCPACPRKGATETVAERAARVAELRPGGEVRIARSPRDLSFRERSLDRRTFFRSLGWGTTAGASALLKSAAPADPCGRSAKQLPRRRAALHLALEHAQPGAAARLADAFSFTLTVDDRCTACPRCAAMCPTGALARVGEGPDRHIELDPQRCSGCRVCEAFCPSGSLRIDGNGACGGERPVPFRRDVCETVPLHAPKAVAATPSAW